MCELNHITEMYVGDFYDGGTHVCPFRFKVKSECQLFTPAEQGEWKQASATAGGVLQAYQQW